MFMKKKRKKNHSEDCQRTMSSIPAVIIRNFQKNSGENKMATADDALKILEKCTLRNARRMRNPGRYNFSIEYGFSEEMNYDKLTGQLESLGFRPLIRNLTTVYTGSDFEVAVRRPE